MRRQTIHAGVIAGVILVLELRIACLQLTLAWKLLGLEKDACMQCLREEGCLREESDYTFINV